jgi:hypothetical protein
VTSESRTVDSGILVGVYLSASWFMDGNSRTTGWFAMSIIVYQTVGKIRDLYFSAMRAGALDWWVFSLGWMVG